jgi:hypothetical protein
MKRNIHSRVTKSSGFYFNVYTKQLFLTFLCRQSNDDLVLSAERNT